MTGNEAQIEARRAAGVFRCGRGAVLDAYPDMVTAPIAQAKKGSDQHARFLFDLVEPTPAKNPEEEEESLAGPSPAEILRERLQALEEGGDDEETETRKQRDGVTLGNGSRVISAPGICMIDLRRPHNRV